MRYRQHQFHQKPKKLLQHIHHHPNPPGRSSDPKNLRPLKKHPWNRREGHAKKVCLNIPPQMDPSKQKNTPNPQPQQHSLSKTIPITSQLWKIPRTSPTKNKPNSLIQNNLIKNSPNITSIMNNPNKSTFKIPIKTPLTQSPRVPFPLLTLPSLSSPELFHQSQAKKTQSENGYPVHPSSSLKDFEYTFINTHAQTHTQTQAHTHTHTHTHTHIYIYMRDSLNIW